MKWAEGDAEQRRVGCRHSALGQVGVELGGDQLAEPVVNAGPWRREMESVCG